MIVFASNIHTGGGKELLDEFVSELTPQDILIVNEKYTTPKKTKVGKIIKVGHSIISRLQAEYLLKKVSLNFPEHEILMFGNLPPMLKLSNKVTVFFQNMILVPNFPLTNFPLKTKVRLLLERSIFAAFKRNIDTFWVQSNYVDEVTSKFWKFKNIKVKPIVPKYLNSPYETADEKNMKYDFICVSANLPHKNLLNLFLAWKQIFEQFPHKKLLIVLNNHENNNPNFLCGAEKYGIMVKNQKNKNELKDLYLQSKNLVFPSTIESFGLPILEAKHYGLNIIASDIGYAKELGVCDAFFDPHSPQEIYESLRKY